MTLKKVSYVLTPLFSLCLISSGHAVSYPWPIINSVDVVLHSETEATYYVTWSVIDVDDPTVSEDDLAVDVYTRKTGIKSSELRTGIYHRHNVLDSSIPAAAAESGIVYAGNSETRLSHASRVARNLVTRGTISHVGGPNGGECVMVLTTDSEHFFWSDAIAVNWDAGVGSAGQCLGTPPANEWCALATPSITYEYGTMQLSDAEGAVLSENVKVQCTTGMKYTLRLQGLSSISLSNRMSVTLTAVGEPLGSTLTGVSGVYGYVGINADFAPNLCGGFYREWRTVCILSLEYKRALYFRQRWFTPVI
ncbi:hypothetical protein GWD52_20060 [Enterobacteriaceae bacterium 4M9]|nr:hypothetical protein [Enterobacteriaceae bacterium 4M9]